jgi:hypothetical protein
VVPLAPGKSSRLDPAIAKPPIAILKNGFCFHSK